MEPVKRGCQGFLFLFSTNGSTTGTDNLFSPNLKGAILSLTFSFNVYCTENTLLEFAFYRYKEGIENQLDFYDFDCLEERKWYNAQNITLSNSDKECDGTFFIIMSGENPPLGISDLHIAFEEGSVDSSTVSPIHNHTVTNTVGVSSTNVVKSSSSVLTKKTTHDLSSLSTADKTTGYFSISTLFINSTLPFESTTANSTVEDTTTKTSLNIVSSTKNILSSLVQDNSTYDISTRFIRTTSTTEDIPTNFTDSSSSSVATFNITTKTSKTTELFSSPSSSFSKNFSTSTNAVSVKTNATITNTPSHNTMNSSTTASSRSTALRTVSNNTAENTKFLFSTSPIYESTTYRMNKTTSSGLPTTYFTKINSSISPTTFSIVSTASKTDKIRTFRTSKITTNPSSTVSESPVHTPTEMTLTPNTSSHDPPNRLKFALWHVIPLSAFVFFFLGIVCIFFIKRRKRLKKKRRDNWNVHKDAKFCKIFERKRSHPIELKTIRHEI